MLPEFRYFSKNFQIKIGFIAKLLFIFKLSYSKIELETRCLKVSQFFLFKASLKNLFSFNFNNQERFGFN